MALVPTSSARFVLAVSPWTPHQPQGAGTLKNGSQALLRPDLGSLRARLRAFLLPSCLHRHLPPLLCRRHWPPWPWTPCRRRGPARMRTLIGLAPAVAPPPLKLGRRPPSAPAAATQSGRGWAGPLRGLEGKAVGRHGGRPGGRGGRGAGAGAGPRPSAAPSGCMGCMSCMGGGSGPC